jgi:hypothetical protein
MPRPIRVRHIVTSALLVSALTLAPGAGAQTMRCESPDGSYRECRIGSNGRVRLVVELSNRRCFEDLTWGTSTEGVVWVSGACSALFEVETGSEARGGEGRRVVCESLDGKLEICRADGSRGVGLARQLGTTPCIEGKSWGRNEDRNRIWVDDGCRGEFVLGTKRGPAEPREPLDGRVVCEAPGKKRRECAADTAAGAQIVRQLGGERCAYGLDWGFEPGKVWVSNRCAAEFAVRGRPMLTTIGCEADGEAEVRCAADAQLGVALVGTSGDAPCTLGASWGFDDDEIWVSKGCRGKFAAGGFRIDEAAVPASAVRISCSSDPGVRSTCAVDGARGVGLVRETGTATCVYNRNWGYDEREIWVEGGCGATFAVVRSAR